ncbi:MAG: hypothetical protein Q8M94_11200, partial [Ignavibacteria bacterium]|nr:hypothetical protein [Ignavibacteria bacterium]
LLLLFTTLILRVYPRDFIGVNSDVRGGHLKIFPSYIYHITAEVPNEKFINLNNYSHVLIV